MIFISYFNGNQNYYNFNLMKITYEDEPEIKPPTFDFTSKDVVNIYDPDFWNIKEVPRTVKAKPPCNTGVAPHEPLPAYGYSKTTRLLLEFRDPTQTDYLPIKLVAYKSQDGKLIPSAKCNKEIIDWCKRNNIEV